MPIYEYHCKSCDAQFEKLTTFSAADSVACEKCGDSSTFRLLSRFGISTSDGFAPECNYPDIPPICGQGACSNCL